MKAVTSRPFPSGVFYSLTTGCVIQLSSGASSTAWIKEGQRIASINGVDIPIEPDSDGVFRPARSASFTKLGMIPIGYPERPTAIQFGDFGMLDDLVWVPLVQTPDVRAIEGHYRSESTGTQLTIQDNEGGRRLNSIGRFGSVKFPLGVSRPGRLAGQVCNSGAGGIQRNPIIRLQPYRSALLLRPKSNATLPTLRLSSDPPAMVKDIDYQHSRRRYDYLGPELRLPL